LKRAFEEALAAIVTLNARHKPMVYIMEDWHWADDSSEAALRRLLGLIPSYPLMVVVIYRPEYEAHWGNLDNHTPLVLNALDREPTESVVKSIFGATSLPEALTSLIHQRTDGNPFFIEEMCGAFQEEGMVRIKNGEATLSHTIEDLRLPDTVQAVIRSRLDRLNEDAREALRLASVIGREFARRILERIHTAREQLASTLEDLKTLELIQQIRVLPEAEYMFKHVITQQVTYETLLLQQRRELHGLVGQAVEALYSENLEEHYETLAHHYSQSDNKDRAIHFLEQAGDKAAGYSSMQESRKHYSSAIEFVDSLDMTVEQKHKRIDLSLKLAAACFYTADENELEIIDTSLAIARSLGDDERLLKVTNALGRMFYSMGNFGPALAEFEKCIQMAKGFRNDEMLALPYNVIGRTCLYTSEYSKAIDYLRQGIPMMERLGNQAEVAWSKSMLAATLAWIGQFGEANALDAEALKLSRSKKDLITKSGSMMRSGFVRISLGNWEEAIRICSEASKISKQIGNQIVVGVTSAYKGYAVSMTGRLERGAASMQKGIQIIEATGSHLVLSVLYAWLAEINALAGNGEDAFTCGKKSLHIVQLGEKCGEVVAHRALAMALAAGIEPDWELVDSHLRQGIRLAKERGELPNLAITHFRSAELLQKKGDLDQAREQLRYATALFREMKMSWWLEQAEALGKNLARS
jgi:tetratricopeptide (TPR) repeat protein